MSFVRSTLHNQRAYSFINITRSSRRTYLWSAAGDKCISAVMHEDCIINIYCNHTNTRVHARVRAHTHTHTHARIVLRHYFDTGIILQFS